MTYKNSARVLFLIACLAIGACRPGTSLPAKSSPEYNELVRTFYIGLAALQVGHDVQADAKLSQFTQLAPAEPAGWANWGLLALRQRNYDTAAERLQRARAEAPDNSQIFYLLGLLESSRGNTPEAIAALRRSVELDQGNLIAIYKLAEEVERQSDEQSAQEVQNLIQKILAAQPENLAALIEVSRAAAKRGDAETFRGSFREILVHSISWPQEIQDRVTAVNKAANSGDMSAAATQMTFLKNMLLQLPEYRRDLSAIKPPPGEEAVPFTHFLRLESPEFKSAAPDTEIKFTAQPLKVTTNVAWIGAIWLTSEGSPVIATLTPGEVRLSSGVNLSFPSKADTPPPSHPILPVDLNSDFKTDLVLVGGGGVRLFRQENPTAFVDVTAATKLPPEIISASYSGAWAADIEADGDLDIVLGSHLLRPKVLRNNGDDTFQAADLFLGISGTVDFAWGDLDADGDADAALIAGGGKLHVFSNERQGQFSERSLPVNLPIVRTMNLADLNDDGVLDLVIVLDDRIVRLSDKDHGSAWEQQDVWHLNWTDTNKLLVADVDNNGALDLLLGPAIGLRGEKTVISPINNTNPQRTYDVADVNGDGRLDLLGSNQDGQPVQAINRGTKNYHWQIVRPRAAQATGDQRINSFGIGGETEIRSGLLVQKQPINAPLLHFGLGEQTSADVIRVVWPNGSVNAEFEVKADQEILTEQRLKGSCPFLFAYNGKQMEFVKDAVPWSSAIGLRINTLGTASVEATEEWYKIGRDQLVPRDGYYDLRITAELWETYYYDHLSLMVVDHPEPTEIFVDERFVIPPAKLAFTTVSTPRKIAKAIDDQGQDVTSIVNTLDGNYLDTFGRGRYQGVTRDHYVEIDLGDDAPATGPLWVIANGWMHPTDSSINVAISQGEQEKAKPLSLEIPDGAGGWRVERPNMGFPAGRKKICLFDLTDVFKSGIPRRLRLRTNLEVYWDSLEWAVGVPSAELRITQLNPDTADLHHRGYSVINQANDSSPQIPDYNRLSGSKQVWRDLIGYYTRFGDVRELLMHTDDRYVIMNAGDEMSFRFAALAAPPAGWVRDYVIVGDGWIKDGDYNSTFSKTVLPLPYHAKNQYITPPGRLEDEWVYRQYPEDWHNYHTRYVTPDVFQNAMRSPTRK
jgi:Tetratricopeptide repeat/FG-GAP-like repeat/ASPIC and UnbV